MEICVIEDSFEKESIKDMKLVVKKYFVLVVNLFNIVDIMLINSGVGGSCDIFNVVTFMRFFFILFVS